MATTVAVDSSGSAALAEVQARAADAPAPVTEPGRSPIQGGGATGGPKAPRDGAQPAGQDAGKGDAKPAPANTAKPAPVAPADMPAMDLAAIRVPDGGDALTQPALTASSSLLLPKGLLDRYPIVQSLFATPDVSFQQLADAATVASTPEADKEAEKNEQRKEQKDKKKALAERIKNLNEPELAALEVELADLREKHPQNKDIQRTFEAIRKRNIAKAFETQHVQGKKQVDQGQVMRQKHARFKQLLALKHDAKPEAHASAPDGGEVPVGDTAPRAGLLAEKDSYDSQTREEPKAGLTAPDREPSTAKALPRGKIKAGKSKNSGPRVAKLDRKAAAKKAKGDSQGSGETRVAKKTPQHRDVKVATREVVTYVGAQVAKDRLETSQKAQLRNNQFHAFAASLCSRGGPRSVEDANAEGANMSLLCGAQNLLCGPEAQSIYREGMLFGLDCLARGNTRQASYWGNTVFTGTERLIVHASTGQTLKIDPASEQAQKILNARATGDEAMLAEIARNSQFLNIYSNEAFHNQMSPDNLTYRGSPGQRWEDNILHPQDLGEMGRA